MGTNDLKPANGTKAEDATKGIRRLIEIVRSQDYGVIGTVPDLLIVAPPPCVVGPDGVTGSGRDLEQTRLLAPMYQALSRELGVAFFDAGEVAAASPLDGVHLDAANTAAIGTALGAFLQSSQNA